MKRPVIIQLICGGLVLLFAYAAGSKLLSEEQFRQVLATMPFVKHFPDAAAIILPLMELLLVLLLMLHRTTKAGLYAALTILTVFTIYLGGMLLFSPNLPCNCGGVLQQLTWRQHIVLNVFFIILTLIAIRQNKLLVATPPARTTGQEKAEHL